MKRLMLGAIAVIVLFFVVLVIVDHVKRPSESDEGQETQSSDLSPGDDGTPQKGVATPTPISDRTIKLALSLPQADANMTVQLLPSADQLVAGDAYVLYTEACNALPASLDEGELSDWARMKPEALPLDRVTLVLDEAKTSLALIDQAIVCTDCNWPSMAVGSQMSNLKAYRMLARLTGVKALYELANNNPQESIQALRMGLGMARHVGQSDAINYGMAGIAMGALISRQIPTFAEQSNGISLYTALASLPAPLISLDKAIRSELDNLDKDPKVNFLNRRAFLKILEPAHERCRFLEKRFNRDMKALQCLEAIRLYAATHNGALPETLNQLTSWTVPDDPVTGQPFVYALSGDTAILEGPAPQGDPKSRLQYQISLKQAP